MEIKPLRVLSIDWDFLVNATLEQKVVLFPDGGNEYLPMSVQNNIWGGHYASTYYGDLKDIKADEDSIKILKDLIKKWVPPHTPMMITDSHKYMYHFVKQYKPQNMPVEIINIDFHHDYYGENFGEIDCGNWVNNIFESSENKLIDKIDGSSYYWVGREDSDEPDGVWDKDWFHIITIDDLQSIVKNQFELLFICRSSVWSPPHLDKEFIEFCDIPWTFPYIVEENCLTSRYTKEFQDSIDQERRAFSKILGK